MEKNEPSLLKMAGIVAATLSVITVNGLSNKYGGLDRVYEGLKKEYAVWQNYKSPKKISKNLEKPQNYVLDRQVKHNKSN